VSRQTKKFAFARNDASSTEQQPGLIDLSYMLIGLLDRL
jgi:hypothetical protein